MTFQFNNLIHNPDYREEWYAFKLQKPMECAGGVEVKKNHSSSI